MTVLSNNITALYNGLEVCRKFAVMNNVNLNLNILCIR